MDGGYSEHERLIDCFHSLYVLAQRSGELDSGADERVCGDIFRRHVMFVRWVVGVDVDDQSYVLKCSMCSLRCNVFRRDSKLDNLTFRCHLKGVVLTPCSKIGLKASDRN